MSGKSGKQRRLAREARRAEERRRERRATLITMGIVGLLLVLGVVLVVVSVSEEAGSGADPELADATTDERPVACGAEAPASADEEKPTFDAPPREELEDGVTYRAVVATSCGELVIELDDERAPRTTANFVGLAERGFYDGLEIFRHAASIAALQTGAGDNSASWQIGYQFADELAAAEEEGYPAGSVAMANSGPDTNGSQFFIVYDESDLPPNYTRFGEVVEGREVLDEIAAVPVEGERPTERIYLDGVRIERS